MDCKNLNESAENNFLIWIAGKIRRIMEDDNAIDIFKWMFNTEMENDLFDEMFLQNVDSTIQKIQVSCFLILFFEAFF